MKQLYAGKNYCIKRVPSDWNKTIIDFHYGGDNKNKEIKIKARYQNQNKGKKRKVRYCDNK